MRIDGVSRQRSDAFESLDLGVQGASFPTIARQQAAASAQIGAWASRSLRSSRHTFERAIALHTAKFMAGAIPRPPNWTSYRLLPLIMEFWQDRPFRLHDRVEFRCAALGQPWHKTRLYP